MRALDRYSISQVVAWQQGHEKNWRSSDNRTSPKGGPRPDLLGKRF